MKKGCDLMNTKASSTKQNVNISHFDASIQSGPKGKCFKHSRHLLYFPVSFI